MHMRWTWRAVAAFSALAAAIALAWSATPAPASAAAGELSSVPPHGAMGLAVWGGGGVDALVEVAAGRGCSVESITANGAVAADSVVYLPDAPGLVNEAFLAAYPGGELPEAAVGVRCAPPPDTFELMVSAYPDRSWAEPVAGADLLGQAYIFVTPIHDVWYVDFYIDDPLAATEPASSAWGAPYDVAGAAFTGDANPFDTSTLTPGPHTLTAVIHRPGFQRPSDLVSSEFHVSGSGLVLADLATTELAGAQLAGADLRAANLRGANLAGADLTGAQLAAASLRGARLAAATFVVADLTAADLGYVQATGADFAGAALGDALFGTADVRQGNFAGAALGGARFDNALLHGADLTGASAVGVNFDGADLGCTQPAIWSVCGGGTDFAGAALDGASFVSANARGANFAGAVLTGVDFTGADLHGAVLLGVDLGTVTWGGTTCPDGTLSDAHGPAGCSLNLVPDPALNIDVAAALE